LPKHKPTLKKPKEQFFANKRKNNALYKLKYSKLFYICNYIKQKPHIMDNSELKKDRFKRVASRRVDNILKGIRSLSKCSNSNNYEYNEEDLNKMVKAIKEELKTMETLYKKNLKNNTESFNF